MRVIWALACVYVALFVSLENALEPGQDGWLVALDYLSMVGWLIAATAALFAKRWLQ